MALIPINTILGWFEHKDKPTQDQFWQTFLSLWHKSEKIPAASIGGLQELLDAKVDKKDLIQNKGVFDPAKAYVFNALLAEYVSFVNEASGDEFYRVERWFRLLADTVAGESPETATAKWKHIGTVLGEIAIEDVVGLREELDALNDGGTGLTPEQAEVLSDAATHMDGVDEGKHATNQIHNLAALVKLALAANTDQATINAAIDTFLAGTINANSINDPAWMISENRLAMLQKLADGTINIQGSALLVNIFAPPGVDTYLNDRSGWTGEQKTITGANFNGELGTSGRIRQLSDGTICQCLTSTKGTSGQANGSATYSRNIGQYLMDPANTQDAAVIAALLVEAGWNATTNVKILSIPARKGAEYKDPSGYFFKCFDVSGTNSYWWRNGTPASRYWSINATSHPVLTGHLLAYDFTSSLYTEVAGDETNTVRGQGFYDLASRKKFEKVSPTQWEKMR